MGCSGSSVQARVDERTSFSAEYDLVGSLNKGTFGQVRSCRPKAAPAGSASNSASSSSSTDLAVKVINLQILWHDWRDRPISIIDTEKLQKAREEVDIWRSICAAGDEHCVRLLQCYLENLTFNMVMERCKESLMDVFEEHSAFNHGEAFPDLPHTLHEMLLAVAHVHRLGIVHRDVKLNNFLLGGLEGRTVKLCDFGLAAKMPRKGLLKTQCGTASYMSPEMVTDKSYGQKTDVWSLGVTAYVLVFGALPYVPKGEQSPEAMKEMIALGHPKPSFTSPWSKGDSRHQEFIVPLVRKLLDRSSRSRCTAEEALQSLPPSAKECTAPCGTPSTEEPSSERKSSFDSSVANSIGEELRMELLAPSAVSNVPDIMSL